MPSVAGISGDNASVFALSPTTEEYVREYFEEIPILADIAWCESRYRQFTPGGDIFRGEVNKEDVGVMQINEHYHLKTAENLDLNLYTLDGNLAYAKYLYEKEGTAPWVHSKKCWGKNDFL